MYSQEYINHLDVIGTLNQKIKLTTLIRLSVTNDVEFDNF